MPLSQVCILMKRVPCLNQKNSFGYLYLERHFLNWNHTDTFSLANLYSRFSCLDGLLNALAPKEFVLQHGELCNRYKQWMVSFADIIYTHNCQNSSNWKVPKRSVIHLGSFPESPECEYVYMGRAYIVSFLCNHDIIEIGLKQKGNVLRVVQPTMCSTLGVYDIWPPITNKLPTTITLFPVLSLGHNKDLSAPSLPLVLFMWEKIPGIPRLRNFNVCVWEHGSLGTRLWCTNRAICHTTINALKGYRMCANMVV